MSKRDGSGSNESASAAPHGESTYTEEEVTEIIGIAMRSEPKNERNVVSHEELLSMASELGLGGGDVGRALQVVAERRSARAMTDKALRTFKWHASAFVVSSILLLLADTPYPWVLVPLLGWGSIVFLHGCAAVFAPKPFWSAVQRQRL